MEDSSWWAPPLNSSRDFLRNCGNNSNSRRELAAIHFELGGTYEATSSCVPLGASAGSSSSTKSNLDNAATVIPDGASDSDDSEPGPDPDSDPSVSLEDGSLCKH